MSSTSAPASQTAQSSASQTAQANRAGQPGARRATEPGADNSLFANLLSLLADTHEQALPELGAELTKGAGDVESLQGAEDTPEDNPLAALAGWPGSPVPAETGNTAPVDAQRVDTPVDTAVDNALDTEADVDPAMQATDEPAPDIDMAADRAAHESPLDPATTNQRPQASQKGLSATALAQAQPIKAGTADRSGAAAAAVQRPDSNGMVWRRTGGGAAEGMSAPSGTAHLAGVRSTVTLNDRFGHHLAAQGLGPVAAREAVATGFASVQASSGTHASTGAASVSGAVGGADASLAAGSASGADTAGGGDHGTDAHGAEQDGQDPEAHEAFTEAEGQQISHWGTQNLRHASLRVGQGGQDAIDIQLSVKGQEVQVDFRTDNADAQASLKNSADESLADMLQRSGIHLAGVSVGAQGQGTDRRASSDETTAQRAGRASQRVADTPVAPQPTRTAPLRADGSRPIDLFV
jgi:hypothetical protein